MNKETNFDIDIQSTLQKIKNLLIVKGKEYRRNNNPYHNFESGALVTGQIPERVLHGFFLKHFVSYQDMLNDIEKGNYPKTEVVEEKFNDMLVYLIIQKAMILERQLNTGVRINNIKVHSAEIIEKETRERLL